jgi:outer membrane protein assembly factor BamB
MSSRSKPRRRGARALLARTAAAGPIAAAALVAGMGLPGAVPAFADTVDPSMPRTVVVGWPRGAAPGDREDGQRSGRAHTRLPFPPVEAWRRHVSGGIELAPLIDAEGNALVTLTVPEVLKLGPDGKEIWRTRIGTAAPLGSPVLTSDGTLALVTSAGLAWGISPSGAVLYTTSLGIRGRDADTGLVALPDGGFAVAAGHTLLEVDADGAVRARTSLDERATGGLLVGPEGLLVTTDTGGVFTWRAPGAPRRLGSFAGTPRRGAALADARTLLAVVDNRRLTALDLLTGTTHVRTSTPPGIFLDGPVAVAASGLALVASQNGLLVGVDGAGNEKVHVAIEKPPLGSASAAILSGSTAPPGSALGGLTFLGPVEQKPSPPVVVDAGGRIGFARAGGRVGVVGPDGGVVIVSDHLCSAPVAVTPAGEARMLVSCRDGAMWMLGE